jgi:hypothetical protein
MNVKNIEIDHILLRKWDNGWTQGNWI